MSQNTYQSKTNLFAIKRIVLKMIQLLMSYDDAMMLRTEFSAPHSREHAPFFSALMR